MASAVLWADGSISSGEELALVDASLALLHRPASDAPCSPRPRPLVALGVLACSDACYSWLELVRVVLVICTLA